MALFIVISLLVPLVKVNCSLLLSYTGIQWKIAKFFFLFLLQSILFKPFLFIAYFI
jgi:hypothetical protein